MNLNSLFQHRLLTTRRQFFGRSAVGIGAAALASLLNDRLFSLPANAASPSDPLPGLPHFPPTAKRVIYLFQSGAPSQMDLFDHKPKLHEWHANELPGSIRMGQRLTAMTA